MSRFASVVLAVLATLLPAARAGAASRCSVCPRRQRGRQQAPPALRDASAAGGASRPSRCRRRCGCLRRRSGRCPSSRRRPGSRASRGRGRRARTSSGCPRPEALVERMLAMAQVGPRDVVYDLGSGDGRMVIAAARRGARAVGVEFNPDLVAFSGKRARIEGVAEKARFVEGDIFATDFGEATVVTLYLLPSLNLRLRPTLLGHAPGHARRLARLRHGGLVARRGLAGRGTDGVPVDRPRGGGRPLAPRPEGRAVVRPDPDAALPEGRRHDRARRGRGRSSRAPCCAAMRSASASSTRPARGTSSPAPWPATACRGRTGPPEAAASGRPSAAEPAATAAEPRERIASVSPPSRLHPALLWLAAFLLMAGAAVWQRLTGPTHPRRVRAEVAGAGRALPSAAERRLRRAVPRERARAGGRVGRRALPPLPDDRALPGRRDAAARAGRSRRCCRPSPRPGSSSTR